MNWVRRTKIPTCRGGWVGGWVIGWVGRGRRGGSSALLYAGVGWVGGWVGGTYHLRAGVIDQLVVGRHREDQGGRVRGWVGKWVGGWVGGWVERTILEPEWSTSSW